MHRTVDGGDYTALYNIINNYYKPGPVTPKDKPAGHRILKPETGRSQLGRLVFGRAYVHGNFMEGYPEITQDNWAGGVQIEDKPDAGDYIDNIRWYKPFPMAPVTLISAEEAYETVLKNAGATLPIRDPVDERIIKQVRTNEVDLSQYTVIDTFYQFKHRRLGKDSYKYGIITDIAQVGGYPEYSGEPYQDADKDGMPDAWEKKYGLDPRDPSDAGGDINGDGYMNIEKYINGIDPGQKIDWVDLENNQDTLEPGDLIR